MKSLLNIGRPIEPRLALSLSRDKNNITRSRVPYMMLCSQLSCPSQVLHGKNLLVPESYSFGSLGSHSDCYQSRSPTSRRDCPFTPNAAQKPAWKRKEKLGIQRRRRYLRRRNRWDTSESLPFCLAVSIFFQLGTKTCSPRHAKTRMLHCASAELALDAAARAFRVSWSRNHVVWFIHRA